MSSHLYAIALPDDDPHAEWREQCRQALVRELNVRMSEIWDETLSRLTDGSNEAGHPIRERLLDLLDRLLLAVQEADRRLRDLQTFKQFIVTLTTRHRQGELTDQEFIARLWDTVTYELLDDASERGQA